MAFGYNFQSKGNKRSNVRLSCSPSDKKRRKEWEDACGRINLPKDPLLFLRTSALVPLSVLVDRQSLQTSGTRNTRCHLLGCKHADANHCVRLLEKFLSADFPRNLERLWCFSTAWYDSVRHGSLRHSTAQFGSVCIFTAV